MWKPLAALLSVSLLLSCTTAGPPPSGGAHAGASAAATNLRWLDALDDRYLAFAHPLELAAWRRAIGEKPDDVAAPEAAEKAFYADAGLRTRLAALSGDPEPEVRKRAAAWLRFVDRDRLVADPGVEKLTDQIVHEMQGREGEPQALMLVKTLLLDDDPAARGAALATIERRTTALLPLLKARAARMDEVARSLGAHDALTFSEGPGALGRLEATCRDQLSRSRPAWDALVARTARTLGRPPGFADYGAAGNGWINEAGSFFKPGDLRRLAEGAFAQMGFDVGQMGIEVVVNPATVGGSAYGVSIPDDVRFQGNFTAPGFYSGRGYFHELGHAVHMKRVRATHLPMRALPQDRALNEAVGEIFTLLPTDEPWLSRNFPALTEAQRRDFLASVRSWDAMVTRYNCLLARFELELHAGRDVATRWPALYRETFDAPPPTGPAIALFVPSYLKAPFYLRGYVYQFEVRDAFVRRLAGTPLLSKDAGAFLDATMLAPGNELTLDGYLSDRIDLPAWRRARR